MFDKPYNNLYELYKLLKSYKEETKNSLNLVVINVFKNENKNTYYLTEGVYKTRADFFIEPIQLIQVYGRLKDCFKYYFSYDYKTDKTIITQYQYNSGYRCAYNNKRKLSERVVLYK